MKFLEACPFHDPVSYADAGKLPSYHIPLWDVENVWRILNEFRWVLRSIRSVDELRNVATFPNIALDRTDGSNFNHDILAEQAWSRMWDIWGEEYKYDLREWLSRFNDPKYLSYNISLRGKVLPLHPNLTRVIVDDYDTRAKKIGRFDPAWYGSGEMIHELRLVKSVLSEMRQLSDSAVSSKDKTQLLVADARMQAYQPILAEVLREMEGLQRRVYWRPIGHQSGDRQNPSPVDEPQKAGPVGGQVEGLQEGDHVVAKSDEQLEHFWCKCGRAISLDLEEIVEWKEKQGVDVEELSRQMQGTSLGSDQSRQLAQGYL